MGNPKKALFYPIVDADIISYYDNVVKKLPAMATKYAISADVMAKLVAHNTKVVDSIKKAKADAETAKASTRAKEDALLLAEKDLKRELQRIIGLANFDEADAQTLGIRKESTAAKVSKDSAKATISGITVLPDQVVIDWVKGKMDGVVVSCSYDGTNFTDIGFDTRSPYEDRRANQNGQPEERYYRLRYLLKDEEVGEYSDIVKATVNIRGGK